jgi:hypothetical protein
LWEEEDDGFLLDLIEEDDDDISGFLDSLGRTTTTTLGWGSFSDTTFDVDDKDSLSLGTTLSCFNFNGGLLLECDEEDLEDDGG